tara:strand:- start:317 stop:439 length:123 start_codon:yes stop_codon:yes gene_type:complete
MDEHVSIPNKDLAGYINHTATKELTPMATLNSIGLVELLE